MLASCVYTAGTLNFILPDYYIELNLKLILSFPLFKNPAIHKYIESLSSYSVIYLRLRHTAIQ